VRLLVCLIAAVIAVNWFRALPESLWLDECGTIFVAAGSWSDLIVRQQFFIGSLPHLAVSWLLLHGFGFSEVLLRLPSLLAMLAAGVLLFLYGRRHLGPATAGYAIALFVVHGDIQAHAIEARPYAFTVLFTIAAFYSLDRWMDERKVGFAVALGLAAGFLPANHLLASAVLPVLALTALSYRQTHPVSHYAALFLSFAVPASLAIFSMRAFDDQGAVQLRGWVARPTLSPWLAIYTHRPIFLPSLAAAAIAFVVTRPWKWKRTRVALPFWVAATGLGVLLPFLVFVVSHVGPVSIFASRYLVAANLGVIFLYALAAHSLQPPRARLAIACALPVLILGYAVVTGGIHRTFRFEDWRGALASFQGRVTTIYMQTGFIEGRDERWLRDPLRSRFLTAPATAYPPGVPVIPLPYGKPAIDTPYMQELLEKARGKSVGLLVFPGEKFQARFTRAGFKLEPVGRFGPLSTWIATAK
jgi:mannosyltransferase